MELHRNEENEDDDDGEYMVIFARPSALRALSASPLVHGRNLQSEAGACGSIVLSTLGRS